MLNYGSNLEIFEWRHLETRSVIDTPCLTVVVVFFYKYQEVLLTAEKRIAIEHDGSLGKSGIVLQILGHHDLRCPRKDDKFATWRLLPANPSFAAKVEPFELGMF